MDVPNYNELEAALARIDSGFSAAGCQGVICGVLAVASAASSTEWLNTLTGEAGDSDNVLQRECRVLLHKVGEAAREQLQDPEMQLELLLPEDDDTALSDRVTALTQWCDGFMFGLALAGIDKQADLPGDSAEVIKDMAEIAKAALDAHTDEDDERTYFEIKEYLKVGVLLICEELQPLRVF